MTHSNMLYICKARTNDQKNKWNQSLLESNIILINWNRNQKLIGIDELIEIEIEIN